MPQHSKALVTIAIGESFQKMWKTMMAETWHAYARRHGYDIVVFDDYLDASPRGRERTPNWQKCLILEDARVRDYEDVVWLDADILINFHAAPCIVGANRPGKVGVVSDHEFMHASAAAEENYTRRKEKMVPPELRDQIPRTIAEKYRKAGLAPEFDDYCNTGVLVMKPALHAGMMRRIYDTYEETLFTAKEEVCINHALRVQDLAHGLDKRFNWCWVNFVVEHYPFLMIPGFKEDHRLAGLCANAAWANSWFIHFTADMSRSYAQLIAKDFGFPENFEAFRDALGLRP